MSKIVKLQKPLFKTVGVLPNYNKYLPIPLVKGEKVIVTEIHAGGFIRIRHGAGKGNSVFSKHYFSPVVKVTQG